MNRVNSFSNHVCMRLLILLATETAVNCSLLSDCSGLLWLSVEVAMNLPHHVAVPNWCARKNSLYISKHYAYWSITAIHWQCIAATLTMYCSCNKLCANISYLWNVCTLWAFVHCFFCSSVIWKYFKFDVLHSRFFTSCSTLFYVDYLSKIQLRKILWEYDMEQNLNSDIN